MVRATRALLTLAALALAAPAAATDLRIPPLAGATATVRLVLADDTTSQVLGWVASEWADVLPARLPLDTEQILSLDATSAIATATGAATCYLVSIAAPGQRTADYCIQLPESVEVQELRDRVGATAVSPDSLVYTLTADERAALDAASDPDAANPIATIADIVVAGGVTALTDLNDVGLTTATAGRLLVADGDSWESVALSGDATLSGLGALAIAANAVALGTDTTGNYVASATASQGLLLAGTEAASLGLIDCAASEIIKRNALDTGWECAADEGGSAGTGTVTSVAISGSDGIQVDSGSPITTAGTIALGVDAATLATHLGLGTAAYTASTAYEPAGVTLAELTDVGVTTPTNRNLLVADGDSWESRALTEADISDLGTYLTAEVNNLTAAVTWATIPDANVPDNITLALESASLTALADDEVLVGSGAGTGAFVALPDCGGEDFTLGYSQATNAWVCNADAGAGGGMTSWTLSADSGTPETITDGNAVDVSGDASGIDTTVSATDTVTISYDATEAEAANEAVLDLQDLQGAVTDAQVPDTITISLAATATALAANGTNCLAGSYPLGVNASGAAETCTDATTEIASLIATHAAAADPHTGYLLESAVDTDITTLTIGASASVSGSNTGDQVLADFTGTLTDGRLCTYDLAGGEIDCDTTATGTGDVVGPASASDNAVARFDGTTGKLIQSSGLLISDLGGDELELSLADTTDTIHLVSNPTSDECGVLIGPASFDCPINKGTYSLVAAVGDNGTYRQGVGIYARDDATTVGLLHGYNTDQLHVFELDVLAGGNLRVEFKDDAEANRFYWQTSATDSYHVAGGTDTDRVSGARVTVAGVLAATGDPSIGDHVGNRDYNDARYDQPSGTITDNCALRADGTTGRLTQCSAVAINDTADVQTAGFVNAEIRVRASTDATVTVNTVDAYEENGTLYINSDNDAQTLQLPAVEVGDAVMLVQANGSSGVLCLSPDASDYIIDAGTRGTVGTDLCSSGAATDLIAIVGISADEWRVINKQGTWSE